MGLGELSPWHLLILAAVILVLFGAKKLPDSARSLGRAMRIFKAETKGLREDDTVSEPQAVAPQQITAPPQAPPVAPADGTTVNGVPLSEAQHSNQPR
jgi:sec-independent protein translocase protein TatA